MSALGGFVHVGGGRAEEEPLDRMAAALSDYGPDGVTVWRGDAVGMVWAKLCTTPEGRKEQQPLADGQAQLTLCFDGRIDNRAELLAKLRSTSEELPGTASDSAVVLAILRVEGDDGVKCLIGDFTLACWDARRRRLFCARSPLGMRPFHWHWDGRTFAFATDPRAVLTLPWISRRINEPLIGEFLALRFTSPTETLWEGVHRLGGGWALAVEEGAPRTWRWQSGPFPEVGLDSDEAYAEQFRVLFDQSLQTCMRASGPVASQLSGGLDSSSVVCRATELLRQGILGAPLQPISAVFPGQPHDEGKWIEAIEGRSGLATTRVHAVPYDWNWAEDWSARTLHLPLRPNTAGTVIAVTQELRRMGVRVLLTGEGGDDWFSGSLAHWPDLVLRGHWLQLLREAASSDRPRWRTALMGINRGVGPLLSRTRRRDLANPHLQLGALPNWIRPEWARRISLSDRVPGPMPMAHLRGFAQSQRALRYDFVRQYINGENALAFAATQQIEMRHPFHDRRLTEFAMGLPGYQLSRHGRRKYILREAMRGTLPELVRTRQSKAVFITPLVDAVVERLRTRPWAELIPVREGWVDAGALENIVSVYRAWQVEGGTGPVPRSHFGAVWNVISVDMWLRAAAGG